jgi:hypothetical protein
VVSGDSPSVTGAVGRVATGALSNWRHNRHRSCSGTLGFAPGVGSLRVAKPLGDALGPRDTGLLAVGAMDSVTGVMRGTIGG